MFATDSRLPEAALNDGRLITHWQLRNLLLPDCEVLTVQLTVCVEVAFASRKGPSPE